MLPNNIVLQNRYEIIKQIGRGGMGAVYQATDTRLRATVAIKQTLVEGEALRRAFEREAQLLAGLRHPTLPRVSDHFTEDNGQFLVMEFIPGDDLGTLLTQRQAPFEAEEVLRWADQLLDALEYLHSRSPTVIHRDIKPQNMKLTDRGEVILLDFGLAKGALAQTRLTATSSIFGYTPHYAPLEQVQGTGTDPRSDLYALAATLYHLLTNIAPPDTLTRASARINEEVDPLAPISDLNPTLPPHVSATLMQALSLRADQRPPTANAMRAALRGQITGQLTAPLNSSGLQTIVEGGPQLVRVAQTQTPGVQPLSAAQATGSTITPVTGTTIAPPTPPVVGPPAATRSPWLLPAMIGAVAALVAAVVLFVVNSGTNPQPGTEGIAIAPPTATWTLQPEETAGPTFTAAPTVDILFAADATRTAVAAVEQQIISRADATRTAISGATEAVVAATNSAQAALEATAQAATEAIAPTAAPTAPAATAQPQNPVVQPTARPPLPPTQPPPAAPATATSAPASNATILDGGGSGELFTGSASPGSPIDPAVGEGGSCIQGRVTDNNNQPFQSFYVQVDNRGRTLPAKATDGGNYRICALGAGEWGVAVYAVNSVPTTDGERGRHQVRVRLSGTPGEVFYVNFKGRGELVPTQAPPPTAIPTTPVPPPSPFDGIWRGTVSGQTSAGEFSGGRFEVEVKTGAVYRISTDGFDCPFETYPRFPNGQPLEGNSFSLRGSPFNPSSGADTSIVFTITGQFGDGRANGRLEATRNGVSCAVATWMAAK